MRAIASSLLALLLAAPAARAESWRVPVDGSVLRAFTVGANPYARGQHRGVDLGASPGSRVRSVCSGEVRFAGRVPRGGRTVSVRCGRLTATYQQLATIAVKRGQHVPSGAALGTVGRSGDPREPRPHLHLGARESATRRYVDPLSLLRGARRAPPVLPAWRGRPPRAPARIRVRPRAVPRVPVARVRPGPVPRLPAARVRPRPVPRVPALRVPPRVHPPVGIPQPSAPAARARTPVTGVPWFTWVGLLSVGLALPITGLMKIRRRRHAAAWRRELPAVTGR